jgi:glycosyltransferase involved in cell wall biosynthesis
MKITHLTASTFFGGPERQMLGLGQHLDALFETSFISFPEGGRCRSFLEAARRAGFWATSLHHDTPWLGRARRELVVKLGQQGADLLCCHGYKANVVGRMACRRLGIPAVAIARGWTGENFRVRLYETLDRFHLRWMDHVVCVSHDLAAKARRAGTAHARISVIHNAIAAERFAPTCPDQRRRLEALFPAPPARLVAAAGRLSPEKGFDILVDAARRACRRDPSLGFLLFGEGALRQYLEQRIIASGLVGRFVLAGFSEELDALMPSVDALVLPSFTEGLPNVVLEAFAAAVPVIATAAGGTPEVVEHGTNGLLVPPGDAAALANALQVLFSSTARRRALGRNGQHKVRTRFTFPAQAQQYQDLFEQLQGQHAGAVEETVAC